MSGIEPRLLRGMGFRCAYSKLINMFKPPLPQYRLSSKDLNQPMIQIRTIGTSTGNRASSGSRHRPSSSNRSFSISKTDLHAKYGIPLVTAQSFSVIDGRDGRSLAVLSSNIRPSIQKKEYK